MAIAAPVDVERPPVPSILPERFPRLSEPVFVDEVSPVLRDMQLCTEKGSSGHSWLFSCLLREHEATGGRRPNAWP